MSTRDPFSSPIIYGQLKRIVEDFHFYLQRSQSANQKFALGIQGPPGYGKTSLVDILSKAAEEHNWLVIHNQVYSDMTASDLYRDLVATWVHAASEKYENFKRIHRAFVRLQNIDIDTIIDSMGSMEEPVFEVLLARSRGDEPSYASFKHDFSFLFRETREAKISGILFAINIDGVSSNLSKKIEQIFSSNYEFPFIVLVKSEEDTRVLDFDRVYSLRTLNQDDIKEFLTTVFQDRQIENTLAQTIYELTLGTPKHVKRVVEELYTLFSREDLQGELVKLTKQILQRGRFIDNYPETSQSIFQLSHVQVQDLGYLLQFEGWRLREIVGLHLLDSFLQDNKTGDWERQVSAINRWFFENIHSFSKNGILRIEDPRNDGKFELNGETFHHLLVQALIEDLGVQAPERVFNLSISSDVEFVGSAVKLISDHLFQRFGFRQIQALVAPDEIELITFCNDWVSDLQQGSLGTSAGFAISNYLYREQPSDFLENLVDNTGESLYYVLGLRIIVDDIDHDIYLLSSLNLNKLTPQKLQEDIEKRFENMPSEALVSLKEIVLSEYTISTLDDICKRAYEQNNFRFVDDIYSAIRKTGVSTFKVTDGREKPVAALQYFERAMHLPFAPQNALDQGLAINNYAFTKIAFEQYEEAIIKWKEALDLFQAHRATISYTLQNLGYAHIKIGDFGNAVQYCNDAILKDNRRNSQVGVLYVKFCFSASQSPLDDWRWELAYNPQVLTASLCTKAAALYLMEEHDEVFSHLLDALRLSPNAVYVHRALGWYYVAYGQLQKALEEFSTAVELAGPTKSTYPCYPDEFEYVSSMLTTSISKKAPRKKRTGRNYIVPVREIKSEDDGGGAWTANIEVKLTPASGGKYNLIDAELLSFNGDCVLAVTADRNKLILVTSKQFVDDGKEWYPFKQCAYLLSDYELDLLQTLIKEWIIRLGGNLND